ncbi:MAG: hypothetical protein EOO77_31950 [Oxalobacteraceae bacterium]|nr:MAG: hypothetical protein EOO77_31950 [Oxalobacteraceae bacterium]
MNVHWLVLVRPKPFFEWTRASGIPVLYYYMGIEGRWVYRSSFAYLKDTTINRMYWMELTRVNVIIRERDSEIVSLYLAMSGWPQP